MRINFKGSCFEDADWIRERNELLDAVEQYGIEYKEEVKKVGGMVQVFRYKVNIGHITIEMFDYEGNQKYLWGFWNDAKTFDQVQEDAFLECLIGTTETAEHILHDILLDTVMSN